MWSKKLQDPHQRCLARQRQRQWRLPAGNPVWPYGEQSTRIRIVSDIGLPL